jgi:serine O-acetyltransferase
MPKSRKELDSILRKDLINYKSRSIVKTFFKDPRYRVIVYIRLGCFLSTCGFFGKSWILRILKNKIAVKYGVDTTFGVEIGPGFRIVHLGGIVIHGRSKIGENFTINNRVTIGQGQRHKPEDVPIIGNNVYVGVGAVILGRINVGDNVVIGALSLVNKSVKRDSTVVGIPFRYLE